MDAHLAATDAALRLLTIGHGTATESELAGLLHGAGVELVVDVRSVPGSRQNPQFSRAQLEVWMPAAALGYRWEPHLGGFRRPVADSPNVALRHPSFRAYADYMATDPFRQALTRVLGEASGAVVAIMCAESLWWRCHRRLIADAATLLFGADVLQLGHDGDCGCTGLPKACDATRVAALCTTLAPTLNIRQLEWAGRRLAHQRYGRAGLRRG